MLFNSFEYILLFLPITFIIYFLLNKNKLIVLSKCWLIFASLFFYSWWNIKYLPLIVISLVINYFVGSTLTGIAETKPRLRKTLFIIGIVFNLSLLGYFKYADFFISNVNSVLNVDISLLHLILPLAISFFTFQQVAFIIESYKKEVSEYNFLNYMLFVCFFPQLIAGPIVHHKEMMPQFAQLKNKIISSKNISIGLFIFSLGLFKKVIIADTLSPVVGRGFDELEYLPFIDAWLVSFAYAFQLYFDFSGYTDMAIGSAKLFNIDLPINFNSPYKAVDIQDFWRRWHITLSRFLRNYLYIPLGGNRKGEIRTYVNLFTTFLLGGLWHGASWMFVFWGALHGIALVVNRLWKKLNIEMPCIFAMLTTFVFVNICWVFFRATSMHDAIKVLKGMFGLNGFSYTQESSLVQMAQLNLNPKVLLLILICFGLAFIFKNTNELAERFKPAWNTAFASAVVFFIAMINLNRISEFLYFQF